MIKPKTNKHFIDNYGKTYKYIKNGSVNHCHTAEALAEFTIFLDRVKDEVNRKRYFQSQIFSWNNSREDPKSSCYKFLYDITIGPDVDITPYTEIEVEGFIDLYDVKTESWVRLMSFYDVTNSDNHKIDYYGEKMQRMFRGLLACTVCR